MRFARCCLHPTHKLEQIVIKRRYMKENDKKLNLYVTWEQKYDKYLTNNFSQHNVSWEDNTYLGRQEIHHILWKCSVRYRVHNNQPLVSIMNQIDAVHILEKHVIQNRRYIIFYISSDLPRCPFQSAFTIRCLCALYFNCMPWNTCKYIYIYIIFSIAALVLFAKSLNILTIKPTRCTNFSFILE